MSNTSDSSQLRKILDQKDNEIDSFKAEARNLQAELAALQRKLELKDREIEDAKIEIRRADGADKDEQTEELGRLQLMLFELKTTRADLLEQLDDAQHEAETLRNQLKKLQTN
jgi:chromosome segregation ATPase